MPHRRTLCLGVSPFWEGPSFGPTITILYISLQALMPEPSYQPQPLKFAFPLYYYVPLPADAPCVVPERFHAACNRSYLPVSRGARRFGTVILVLPIYRACLPRTVLISRLYQPRTTTPTERRHRDISPTWFLYMPNTWPAPLPTSFSPIASPAMPFCCRYHQPLTRALFSPAYHSLPDSHSALSRLPSVVFRATACAPFYMPPVSADNRTTYTDLDFLFAPQRLRYA